MRVSEKWAPRVRRAGELLVYIALIGAGALAGVGVAAPILWWIVLR